ncbi:MAG: prepilin-type N-terminal cleavage/methylation domain-containing protein [Armatimonadota bacterium]
MSSQKGFTLIELLVVIAIIAILAAILFPVFSKAQDSANVTACSGNMKQIGTAILLYAENNNGNCPPCGNIWQVPLNKKAVSSPNEIYLFEYLSKYTMSAVNLSKCRIKPARKVGETLYNIWYEQETPTKNKPSKYYGATYTPSLHHHYKGKKLNNSRIPLEYGILGLGKGTRGAGVNLDTFNYKANLRVNRKSDALILTCLSASWNWVWNENRDKEFMDPATGRVYGRHGVTGDNGLVLFADMHVKEVPWHTVGGF